MQYKKEKKEGNRIMDLVCPFCNGIQETNKSCPKCSNTMGDDGPIVNYLDDYSPYLSNDITQLVDGVPHDQCLHLFSCSKCGYDERVIVNRVSM